MLEIKDALDWKEMSAIRNERTPDESNHAIDFLSFFSFFACIETQINTVKVQVKQIKI